MLATSERLASTGRVELSRGALAGVVLAIRAEQGSRNQRRVARCASKAGAAQATRLPEAGAAMRMFLAAAP